MQIIPVTDKSTALQFLQVSVILHKKDPNPAFTSFFGVYNSQVYTLADHLLTNDRYYVVSFNRALGGSATTPWISGTEYKIFTAKFLSSTPAPYGQVKIADYLDGGSDFQGNFYTADGLGNYYVDYSDSRNNFYSTPAISVVGGTVENGYVQTIASILLPVDILSFSGYKDGNRNQLKWTTSTEQNNKGFEVLRSLDGVNYSSIGFVNSLANGGNSSVHLDYSFTDNAPAGDRQFYRLRQVDLNGRSKLSNIVMIKGDKPTIFTINGMFPNPATTTLNLMIGAPNKDKLSVVVFDMNGKMVMQRSLSVETGSNTLPVDVTALAGGTYMLKLVSSNGEVSTAKFVKN